MTESITYVTCLIWARAGYILHFLETFLGVLDGYLVEKRTWRRVLVFYFRKFVLCLCWYLLLQLGFNIYVIEVSEGSSFSLQREREKGVKAASHSNALALRHYQATPQSVRVFISFHFNFILYSFFGIRPPCGDGPPWLWVKKEKKIGVP